MTQSKSKGKNEDPLHRPLINSRGSEINDSTMVETPLHIKRPMTMAERLRLMVQGELSRRAEEAGHETFEEADDFDVGDDYDRTSPYELNFDQSVAEVPREKPGHSPESPSRPSAKVPGASEGHSPSRTPKSKKEQKAQPNSEDDEE